MSKEKNIGSFCFWKIAGAIFLLLMGFATTGFAQIPVQTIRGEVLDAVSLEPLIGASVYLPETEPLKGTVTGLDGDFELSDIPVGRYRLEISYIGYEPLIYPEILLNSGHELVLDVLLEQDTSNQIESGCIIYAPRYEALSQPLLSSQIITVEEAKRYPATFNDPARLAMSYAGVVSANDQSNNMVIRGNSPNGMTWYLEGVEIVNPNHLSNSGTASDRLTANGGGVNILSAQMLGTSTFMSGAFPAGNGNALSGIMNMKLRDGNNRKHQFTSQVGLLGIDVAAEGPLSAKKEDSYLVNYRYSTLGVLSALGVDLGEEAFAFQDLAFKINLPNTKLGNFSLFGMGGMSSMAFASPRDTALWEIEKDQYDIDFRSKMGLVGLTHAVNNGGYSSWRSSLIFSGVETTRKGVLFDRDLQEKGREEDLLRESKLALSSTWNYRGLAYSKVGFQVGMSALLLDNEVAAQELGETGFSGFGTGWLLQPFTNFRLRFHELNLTFLAGLHYSYFTFNNTASLEPRSQVQWKLKKHNLSIAYGLHSKIQQAHLYQTLRSVGAIIPENNRDLEFTKSHHFTFAHQWFIRSNTRLQTELYYQHIFNVPESSVLKYFSAINLADSFVPNAFFLKNSGIGRNYGVEISLQQFMNNGFYYLLNGSLYESKYIADRIIRDTRFNGNFTLNMTVGKEKDWEKKGSLRTLGVSARLAYFGGFREMPIDIMASEAAGKTVYDASEGFSVQLPDYFKIDVRIYHRKDKEKYNRTFALDLQNISNNRNLAFYYYDALQGKILEKNQLGLIPNLTWRIEF